jgi:hypothetical protein
MDQMRSAPPRSLWLGLPVCVLALVASAVFTAAFAHGVADGDKGYIQESSGILFGPFVYLGAKHMVTGYDHLLFLFGVIFYLYRLKDVSLYVTMFAIGHSITLIAGVLLQIQFNAYLTDAIIGLSVVYKALDNLSRFRPGDQAARFRARRRRASRQSHRLQCRRGAWAIARLGGHPHSDGLLASTVELREACGTCQCRAGDRGHCADGLPARRLL